MLKLVFYEDLSMKFYIIFEIIVTKIVEKCELISKSSEFNTIEIDFS